MLVLKQNLCYIIFRGKHMVWNLVSTNTFSFLNKSPKGQRSLIWVQHAQKVKYGLFSDQGRYLQIK